MSRFHSGLCREVIEKGTRDANKIIEMGGVEEGITFGEIPATIHSIGKESRGVMQGRIKERIN